MPDVTVVVVPVVVVAIEVQVVRVVAIVLVWRRTPIVTVRPFVVKRRTVTIARSRHAYAVIIYTEKWQRSTILS